LGLIFNPQKYSAHVKVMSFKNNFFLNSDPASIYLIYVLRGSFQLNDLLGKENETFFVHEIDQLQFKAPKNSTMALFKLDAFN
jgi:hypothetical protein